MTRRIGILGFDGIQALDLVGPADAFGSDAFDTLDRNGSAGARYDVTMIGLTTRRFTSTSGVTVRADVIVPTSLELETVIVPAGTGLPRPGVPQRAAPW